MALQPVLASSQGSLLNVATALFYPVADLTLLAIVIGAFAMSGWRLGRTWWLLASGLVIFTVTDAVYAMLAANQAFTDGMWLDAGWTTGMVLMAVASARHPRLHEHADAGTAALGVPGVAKLAAIGVLVTGALEPVPRAAVILAAVTLLGSMLRTVLTFRELRALSETRRQAVTDELTGLGNRRLLYDGLRRGPARRCGATTRTPSSTSPSRPA